MAINKSTQLRGTSNLPPRTLDVRKFAESRASEVEALHSIVANRLNNDFRSQRNKRRRTTGHDDRVGKNRYKKRQKVGKGNKSNNNTSESKEKENPRYIRRKNELKKNPQSGFCTSGDGTKRLRTHLWHAKRFTMTKCWGFHLPLGLHGRGRGSRAVLKWLKHGTLVHDSSYTSAIQLEGPENVLLSILGAVLTPAPLASSEDFPNKILSGAVYGKAMLHHAGDCFSPIIAPVMYMWRPLRHQYTGGDAHGRKIDNFDDPVRSDDSHDPIGNVGSDDLIRNDGSDDPIRIDCSDDPIRIDCSDDPIRIEGSEDPVRVDGSGDSDRVDGSDDSVRVDGSEDPIRIVGSDDPIRIDGAEDTIGIDGSDETVRIGGSSSTRRVWVWIHTAAFREGYEALRSACQTQTAELGALVNCVSLEGELAQLNVMGSKACELLKKILHPIISAPQTSWELKRHSVDEADVQNQFKHALFDNEDHLSTSTVISLTVNDPRVKDEVKGDLSLEEISVNKKDGLYLKPEEISCDGFDSLDLWDAFKGICPPVEENLLCMERHQKRLSLFCLSDKNFGEASASTKGQFSKLCPILLLRNNNLADSIMSWSIILPISWVNAFWNPLVTNGAHAIGLREKHWISSESGLPYFPNDFPDCNAYHCLMTTEEATADEKALLCPPSMRAFKVPLLLPWECVRSTLEELSRAKERVNKNKGIPNPCLSTDLRNCPDVPFEGFVARTSYSLNNFLCSISGDHLLLFPCLPNKTKCIFKYMKAKETHGSVSLLNYDKRLCFLRVVLHAYKEGAFEDGAVVCAPRLADIKLWTARTEDNNGPELQIHQSSLASYFVQKPQSGKWEVQVPDNPEDKESHRWPIGFVTTGFVRGSKKPAAMAVCEAILLANLREEQWNNELVPVKKRKKEVYVLVRNLRSTAYRLARATILLEYQQDDIDYM